MRVAGRVGAAASGWPARPDRGAGVGKVGAIGVHEVSSGHDQGAVSVARRPSGCGWCRDSADHGAPGVAGKPVGVRLVLLPRHQTHPESECSDTYCTAIGHPRHQTHPESEFRDTRRTAMGRPRHQTHPDARGESADRPELHHDCPAVPTPSWAVPTPSLVVPYPLPSVRRSSARPGRRAPHGASWPHDRRRGLPVHGAGDHGLRF